jgi:uncharacterized phage infection (PIP) family protein YhgE
MNKIFFEGMENVTYEQVLELIAQTGRQLAATDRQLAATDRQLAATDRQLAETNRQLAETDKQLRNLSVQTKEEIRALSVQTREEIRALSAETDKQIREMSRKVGEITDTLGKFAEQQVRPKILELFKSRNIELEEIFSNVIIQKEGKFWMEIDLLLVNSIYSVIAEVKHTMRQADIDYHIERLEKLQQMPHHLVEGTTMYGSVAGMIMTSEVERYAIKKGLFVIKPKGDGVEISNAPDFDPKGWTTVFS